MDESKWMLERLENGEWIVESDSLSEKDCELELEHPERRFPELVYRMIPVV